MLHFLKRLRFWKLMISDRLDPSFIKESQLKKELMYIQFLICHQVLVVKKIDHFQKQANHNEQIPNVQKMDVYHAQWLQVMTYGQKHHKIISKDNLKQAIQVLILNKTNLMNTWKITKMDKQKIKCQNLCKGNLKKIWDKTLQNCPLKLVGLLKIIKQVIWIN